MSYGEHWNMGGIPYYGKADSMSEQKPSRHMDDGLTQGDGPTQWNWPASV